ncbi:hypothetical protein [Virgisporangium aliadipatigenens]|uniref:hypothetical protein n=1 Tax=Virgisporangium aliadipatigenens TaxID=741659 RepID=UPI001945A384|nr:hypothetical protein [Virgisporangium aliadipatigenens]
MDDAAGGTGCAAEDADDAGPLDAARGAGSAGDADVEGEAAEEPDPVGADSAPLAESDDSVGCAGEVAGPESGGCHPAAPGSPSGR